jgi:hypothetical protein
LQAKTTKVLDPFRFVLIAVAGWMNQQQQDGIDTCAKKIESFANSSAADGCD